MGKQILQVDVEALMSIVGRMPATQAKPILDAVGLGKFEQAQAEFVADQPAQHQSK